MKKLLYVVGMVLLVSGLSFASISQVAIVIDELNAQGVTAEYKHDYDPTPDLPASGDETQKLEFRNGTQAVLYDTDGVTTYTYDCVVGINLSLVTDNSSAGWADATFNTVNDWTVDFLVGGVKVGGLEGIGGAVSYHETEGLEFGGTMYNAGQFSGYAMLQLLEADLTFIGGGAGEWAGGNGSDVEFSSSTSIDTVFDSYLTDDYLTTQSSIWLTVPEPATLALLGLGGLLLRRRK